MIRINLPNPHRLAQQTYNKLEGQKLNKFYHCKSIQQEKSDFQGSVVTQ